MPSSNTKERIFEQATRLIAEKGYGKVNLREIAKAAGITEAAIYRHYENKAAILDDIIAKLKQKLASYLLTKNQVDSYIETDTTRQLLERCIGRFSQEDTPFMVRAYRIVYMEQLTNEAAMDLIISQLYEATAQSIQYVLDKLMERERIPAFDTWFFSMLWTQSMFAGAVLWMSRYYNGKPLEISAAQYNTISERIVDMAMNGKIPLDANVFFKFK